MDGYEFTASIVSSIAGIAWPVAALGCVFLVRKELRNLISKLKSLSFGGNELQFDSVSAIVGKTQKETVELMRKPPLVAPVAENLSTLTNEELKRRVSDFANKIRRWEDILKARRGDVVYALPKLTNWEEYTERILSESNMQNHVWRSEYQPQAQALRDELLRRQPNTGLQNSPGAIAIDNGILVGAAPVYDAANLLERLAHRLT